MANLLALPCTQGLRTDTKGEEEEAQEEEAEDRAPRSFGEGRLGCCCVWELTSLG